MQQKQSPRFCCAEWQLGVAEEVTRLGSTPGSAVQPQACVSAAGTRGILSPSDLSYFLSCRKEGKVPPSPWPCHSFLEHLQELP